MCLHIVLMHAADGQDRKDKSYFDILKGIN